MTDGFKSFDEVSVPEPQLGLFGFVDPKTGEFKNITLDDYHESISRINLHDGVPEGVRSHFGVSKNLLLYAWYVYRFMEVAAMHSAISLELAIKKRCELEDEHPPRGLYRLICFAEAKGWVKIEGFTVWQNAQQTREVWDPVFSDDGTEAELQKRVVGPHDFDYIGNLKKCIPKSRNHHAHGAEGYGLSGFMEVQVHAEFINQLFEMKVK